MNTQIKVLVFLIGITFAISGYSATAQSNLCNSDNVAKVLGVASTSGALIATKVTVATISTTAPSAGMAGWVGFTTTSTTIIAIPAVAFVIAGGLLAYGAYVYFHPTECNAQGVKH